MHVFFFFFFNDTATTEIYTFSLHDALPISRRWCKRMDFELRAVEEHCALALRIDLEHLAVVAAADEQRAVGLRDERPQKRRRRFEHELGRRTEHQLAVAVDGEVFEIGRAHV